jgi:hypothetical protein
VLLWMEKALQSKYFVDHEKSLNSLETYFFVGVSSRLNSNAVYHLKRLEK